MDYGMWTAHATVGATIAAFCCTAVMLIAGQAGWSERLERPAMLLCFMVALAMFVLALSAVPRVDSEDLAKALIIGWGIVLARRLRAQLIQFTREMWWSPRP